MNLEIRYPTGSSHTVEYPGKLVSIGRDPSCDLVLNDAKCSRRHAVIEDGPSGLALRDTGSANGVFLNGKRVERAILRDGDLLRIGEVIIKVLGEKEAEGTVIVESEELKPLPPPPMSARSQALPTTRIAKVPSGAIERAGPPPQQPNTPAPGAPSVGSAARADSSPRVAARRAPAHSRPLTVSVLAILWALAALAWVASGITVATNLGWSGLLALGAAAGGLLLAVVSVLLAFGLWSQSPWARPFQIAMAALGILACPFLPASVTTLIYMLRPEVRAAFQGKRDLEGADEATTAGSAETAFSLSILGMVLLGFIVSVGFAWWSARGGGRVPLN
jgi:predicted component of type VI protein secretion system